MTPANPYSEFFLYRPTLGETERKRSSPRFHVLPRSGGEVSLVVVAKKKHNLSSFGLQFALIRAHANRHHYSHFLLGLIRENNGWLLTRKGLSAFKLALFAARIFLINLIQIFYEKLSI